MKITTKLLFITILLMSSCIFIKFEGNTVSNTYSKFVNESKMKVKFNSTSFCDKTFNDTIYALKGSELKFCISNEKKAIIYLWSPFCKSEACLSIGAVQDYCDENDYSLFVVCETYDDEIITVQRPPVKPFYSIDHNYHKSNFADKHVNSFVKELKGSKKHDTRYLEFIDGKFLKCLEIDKLI